MTEPGSPQVAVVPLTLPDGQRPREMVLAGREFITTALEDAIAWCHEQEGPGGYQPGVAGRLVDYDAALTYLRLSPADCPGCGRPTPTADVRGLWSCAVCERPRTHMPGGPG